MHAAFVDPQELAVPPSIFEACASEKGLKTAPHVAKALVMSMWDADCVISKQRPSPDTANLISQSDIASFAKNNLLLKTSEAWLAKTREVMLPLLERNLTRNEALEALMQYEVAAVRLIFAKKLSHNDWLLPKGFTTGQRTEDKHTSLLAGYLKPVDQTYGVSLFSGMGVEDPSKTLGTSTSDSSRKNVKDAVFDVDTSVFTIPSESDGSFEPPFPVGSIVKLTSRVSRSCPQKRNPGHFKDTSASCQF